MSIFALCRSCSVFEEARALRWPGTERVATTIALVSKLGAAAESHRSRNSTAVSNNVSRSLISCHYFFLLLQLGSLTALLVLPGLDVGK